MARRKHLWDLVIVSAAVGICLVAKVWILRRVIGTEVDVLELLIPPLLLTVYGYLHQMAVRGRMEGRFPWHNAWLWVGITLVATAVSLVPYL
ncbi:hypothetical protein KQI52_14625 [bacterium]|nr:hypothetical protein [bacterium]